MSHRATMRPFLAAPSASLLPLPPTPMQAICSCSLAALVSLSAPRRPAVAQKPAPAVAACFRNVRRFVRLIVMTPCAGLRVWVGDAPLVVSAFGGGRNEKVRFFPLPGAGGAANLTPPAASAAGLGSG